jgi:hypothetical protein
MWKWDQSAGELSHNGRIIEHGYAGNGKGLNSPNFQDVRGIGPIPRGMWKMVSVGDIPNTGRFTIVLEPMPGTDTRGRSEFRIHGDNSRLDKSASHGCIILPRNVRGDIWASGDHELQVVA